MRGKRKLVVLAFVVAALACWSAVQADSTVFMTEHGARYHLYRDCGVLKRAVTVKVLALSAVGDHLLCSVCKRRRDKGK